MADKEKLRIDKYLWAIRVFKTRTMATEACKAGRVKLAGNNVKASHEVKPGEIYHVSKGIERREIKVTALLYNRVDASKAIAFYEDVTPVEKTEAFKSMFHSSVMRRDRGAGRPTKKERRDIDGLMVEDDANRDSFFDED